MCFLNSESSAAKAVTEITPDAHQACLSSSSAWLHVQHQKKLPDPSSTLADISEKVLGSCRWTLSPQSCSPCEQCESIKMCVFPCKLSERACKNITKNSRSFWHQLRIRSPIISSIIEKVNKVSSSSGSEALNCAALQDVLSNDTLYLHLCCLPSKGVRFKRH